jgi:hypothetical protein
MILGEADADVIIPNLNMQPAPKGPVSMILGSYEQSGDESDGVVDQMPHESADSSLVLALPTNFEHVNFLHHELPLEDLNVIGNDQQGDQALPLFLDQNQLNNNDDLGDHNIQNVGLVLLPNLIDPVFEAFSVNNDSQLWFPSHKVDSIRLWVKHFAPGLGQSVIEVPKTWRDFVTFCLMTLKRFEWAKTFLNSQS